jgi:hypothetical protein
VQQFLTALFRKLMKTWSWVLLILLTIFIKWSSLYPGFIEKYYSNGFYPVLSKIQRILFGWIPFSIGDLIYGFFIIVMLVKIWQLLAIIFKRKFNRQYLLSGLRQIIFYFLFLYVFFYLFWGLNYNRKSIANQLDLKITSYSAAELDTLGYVLQKRLNYYAAFVTQERDSFRKKKNLFRESAAAFKLAREQYPFLRYHPKSIKPSLFSYAGNIMGFQGYYNPFSGEGQVNTTVPIVIQPFVTCHEIGHQVGFGKENEANFAGFLACRLHPSHFFRYSVYFDMFNYTINEIRRTDSLKAIHLLQDLHPQAKQDRLELKKFFEKYKNPIEPVIMWIYDQYLVANDQPAGKRTYSEVIGFLIAYQRKFGTESL